MSTITDSITPLELVSTLNGAITDISTKQDILVAGDNIKTVNSISILGEGDLEVASASQGSKADTALQPEDVTSTYSASGTNPVNGTAVASAVSNLVPDTRTVNGKALSSNISLSASDVSALPSTTTINDLTNSSQQNALNSGVTSSIVSQATTALQPSDVVSTYLATGTVPVNGTAVADALSTIVFPTVDETYSASSTNAQSGTAVASAVSGKQDALVSGTNIKTINGSSILGSGDIEVASSADQTYSAESTVAQSGVAVAQAVAGKASVVFVDWNPVSS